MTSPRHAQSAGPGSATHPEGDIVVHVFGRTDVGRMREHNEDTFLVADLSSETASPREKVSTHLLSDVGSLFMVADGLGGAAAGEIASQMAVETVFDEMRRNWVNEADRSPEAFAISLKAACETANAKINAFATAHPEHRGMGTTATIAGLLGDTLYLVQVGDSRAYLVRDYRVQQITKDQSLMQRLIDAGEMTEEEAERSERRNIILQALGPEPVIRVDLTYQPIRHGDALVLCTDGLFGQVRRDELEEVIQFDPDLVQICKELIDRANESGGPDNITVIAARFAGRRLDIAGEGDRIGHEVFPVPGLDFAPTEEEIGYVPVAKHTATLKAVTTQLEESHAPHPVRTLMIIAVVTAVVAALGFGLIQMLRKPSRPAPRPAPSVQTPATPTSTPPTVPPTGARP
ncbi:MAG: protein phosphatase 2C domain-containing protein [Gemmatimonadota bacterium]|nr:protein phosphatase 2C domain-containing protein [Gemmatimonadota bacterium]